MVYSASCILLCSAAIFCCPSPEVSRSSLWQILEAAGWGFWVLVTLWWKGLIELKRAFKGGNVPILFFKHRRSIQPRTFTAVT